MTNIDPREIHGNWTAGWALDVHTLSSRPLPGTNRFDTTRTELGELVYKLKNKDAKYNNRSKIEPIAEIAAKFVKEKFKVKGHFVYPYLKAIIPTPPSNQDRCFQPVVEIAVKMGEIMDLPVPINYLTKVKETAQQKNRESERGGKERLQGAFNVSQHGKYNCVLLFDDIYQSGKTLTEVTDVLQKQGGISRVLVLTLTQTRTKT